MERRKIGALRVTVVGLGCNNFGRRLNADQTTAVVQAALESGINFFDTADIYGDGLSEEYLGRALGSRRNDVVVATKFGGRMPDGSGAGRSWVRQAVEDSLRRLGTDHIDLYQLHMPDDETSIAETLEILEELVRSGLVREVGCSNFSVQQIDEAVAISAQRRWAQFESVQNHYNLLHREAEDGVLEACRRHGLAFIPYFPLASGVLTGKYQNGVPEGSRLSSWPAERTTRLLEKRNLAIVDRLEDFCRERERTLVELAVSWLLSQPQTVSVIAGATSPEQVRVNATAAEWRLSPRELVELDLITGAELLS